MTTTLAPGHVGRNVSSVERSRDFSEREVMPARSVTYNDDKPADS